ncbi:MAG: hypothetical protein ACREN5_01505 [Gemmatimonadales bacterium]
MALVDLLGQHGVDVSDKAAVYELLLRLPLAGRSRVELWSEYVRGRGEEVTDGERAALSA